jgi:ABC-type nitrate/sulfonate/bicarbonate transport system substrate-binding protein
MVKTLERNLDGREWLASTLVWSAATLVTATFCWLLGDILWHGLSHISWTFLTSSPRNAGREGGIGPILVSTALILGVCLSVSVPIGVGTAVLLAEFTTDTSLFGRLTRRSLDVLSTGAVVSNFPARGQGKVFLLNNIEYATAQLWVRDDSIKSIADLKGKKIGVTSMASAGVIVARALVKAAGMNPDSDVSIIVAGESAQTAALLNSKQVDALSQFDTQYALTSNAGAKLRLLDHPEIRKFPSNGFVALEDYLKNNRKEAVALARGYAKGTIFAIANPEAAIRILWEMYPQTKATGKDEATALRDDLITLEARAKNWRYEQVDGKRWGDNVEANYQAYLDWLQAQGIIKTKTDVKDIVTNELLDEAVNFDEKAVIAEAKAYKAK